MVLVKHLNDPSKWEWRKSPSSPLSSPASILSSHYLQHDWSTCSQFPSQIHCELLAKDEIPHPFKGMNEEKLQWVGEEDWLYRTEFLLREEEMKGLSAWDLVFEGLDTFASVFLNNHCVLESSNMFLPQRTSITALLKPGETNVLLVVFASAFIKGRKLEEEHLGSGKHLQLWNGDASRLWIRKAGYNYGWDWGPVFMTAGPWRPIRLEGYAVRILDFWPRVSVDEDLLPMLSVEVMFSSPRPVFLNLTLTDQTGTVIRKFSAEGLSFDGAVVQWTFKPGEVSLWYSVGLGAQPLYTVLVEVVGEGGKVLDSVSQKVGFRRVRIRQDPLLDAPGTSFCFEINNITIFCGGSNWIPIDSFLSTASDSRYRAWLELLVTGNQNMIRCWGGGVYEDDSFYNICDELGILVWQDFAFACGQYPAHAEFLKSVKAEAEANVIRLRHHPALVIFAGNNEDYQLAEQSGLEYDPIDQSGDWSNTNFPARTIYERTLPEVVERLSDVYYHPGSPWSPGGKPSSDLTVGDQHQWNVWHGSQEPYQSYDKLAGRFVSEFGMQGYPDIRTIDYWLDGSTTERYPQSKMMGFHNKATGYERRQELYLIENIRHSFELEEYAYGSQLIQSECLSTAFRAWRRNFKGPGKEYSAGALVWQLNDVYPACSWAIVDYFLRPKPAYYSIKQSLAQIAVGTKRATERIYPNPYSAAEWTDNDYVEVWAANSTLQNQEVVVVVASHELLTGVVVHSQQWTAILLSNQSTELLKMPVPAMKHTPAAVVIVSVKLLDAVTGEVISRSSAFPDPLKYLSFPSVVDVALRVDVDRIAGLITIGAQRSVKGLIFSFSTNVVLSDNCLDLVPNEGRIIAVKGMQRETAVTWRYLGAEAGAVSEGEIF